jgi:hypothetical protein
MLVHIEFPNTATQSISRLQSICNSSYVHHLMYMCTQCTCEAARHLLGCRGYRISLVHLALALEKYQCSTTELLWMHGAMGVCKS